MNREYLELHVRQMVENIATNYGNANIRRADALDLAHFSRMLGVLDAKEEEVTKDA